MGYANKSSELVVKYLFTTAVITRPTGWQVALFNGDPESGGTEFVDTAYARQTVAFTGSDPELDGRWQVDNDALVSFPAVQDAGGSVDYFAVYDTGTSTLIATVPMAASRTLATGDVLEIPAGALVIKGE